MNAQHTKGPWFLEDAVSRVPNSAKVAIGGPGWSELAHVVTHVEGMSGDEPNAEGRANARLIAAAPELLDLAYQYLSDLRYPPTGESLDRRIEEARRVILNALGDA